MTTDPKALIERADRDLKEGADLEPILLLMKLALRDLTSENERLKKAGAFGVDVTNFASAEVVRWEAEVARLKALGDGLAIYAWHKEGCRVLTWTDEVRCTCGMSAALAAWETRDV